MKKKSILIILIFIVIIGGILAISQKAITCYFESRSFLSELKQGDFAGAFAYVSYYDYANNKDPEISYEEAKEIWVSRMTELKEKGIYVEDYRGLFTYLDDSYPKGKATLVITNNGVINEYECDIKFSKRFGKWKVEQFYFRFLGIKDSELEESTIYLKDEFEKAVSGYVSTDADYSKDWR